MVLSWIRKIVARLTHTQNRKPVRRTTRRPLGLGVETLETRCVLSTIPSALSIPALGGMTIPLGNTAQVTLDNSGNLASASTQFNGGSFTKGGVTFTAQNMQVVYTAVNGNGTSEFDLSGTASATLAGKTVTATFGSATTPGIVIQGSSLESLSGTLTLPNVSVGDATLNSSSVTVSYNASNDEIDLSGSATLQLKSGQNFSLTLGNATTGAPGVAIVGGQVTSVNGSVSGSFNLGSLSVHSDGLQVAYTAASAGSPQIIDISGGPTSP